MFLTESYAENTASYDPMYGAQLIQEASDEWNDLCMKMIKLEHTAIVSEDSALLQEGLDQFKQKAKAHLQLIGKKFIEYLERVRVQWTKIQAAVQSKFVNTNLVAALAEKMKNGDAAKLKIQMDKDVWNAAQIVLTEWSQAVAYVVSDEFAMSSAHVGDSVKVGKTKLFEIDGLTGAGTISEVTVDGTLVKQAVDFLRKRPIAVKNIQAAKGAITKVMNKEIDKLNKDKKTDGKNTLVAAQRYFNKLIIALNKVTSTAVKICNAVKNEKSGVSKKVYKDTKKTVKKQGGIYSESVLDLF